MIFRPSFFCVSIVPVVNINLQAPLRFAKVSAEVAPEIGLEIMEEKNGTEIYFDILDDQILLIIIINNHWLVHYNI